MDPIFPSSSPNASAQESSTARCPPEPSESPSYRWPASSVNARLRRSRADDVPDSRFLKPPSQRRMSFQTEMVFACCLTSDLGAGRVSGPRFFARARAAREAFPGAGRAPAAPGVVRDVERHEPALALELVHEQAEARRELRGPEIVVRGDLRPAGPLREGLHGRPPRAAGAAGDVTGRRLWHEPRSLGADRRAGPRNRVCFRPPLA